MRMTHSVRALIALGLLVCVAALAACGGSDTKSSGGSSASATKDPTGSLTVWTYYDEGAGGLHDALPEWQAQLKRKFPKLDVKFQTVGYDDMTRKLTAASAAGKGPDVALVNGGSVPELVKAGAVQPLDDEWNGYADKAQFPTAAEDSLVYQGKRYSVQAYTNIVGLYYNEKILKALGVGPPANLQELSADLAKAQSKGYKPLTVSAPAGAGGEFTLAAWLLSNGWTYQKADDPAGQKIMQTLGQWRDQGYIQKADASGFNAATNFATGKYAFAVEGNWNLGTFAKDIKFPYGVQPMQGLDRSPVGGEVAVIGGNAKDKGAAWAVIQEMLLSKQGGLIAAKGGSVPLRKDVASAPQVTKDEKLSEFTKIAAKSTGIPLSPNSGKVSNVMGDAFNQLIAGKLDGDAAWSTVAKNVPQLVTTG